MKKTFLIIVFALVAAAAVVGCAGRPEAASTAADPDLVAAQMVKAAFRSEGIATVERVTNIDETLRLCNAADVAGKQLDAATAKRIEEANLKTVKWPSDGKYLGDWKQGEQIAQSGLEMEELEAFVLEKVQAGAPIAGTYPPSEPVRVEYEAWKKKR